LAHHLDIRVLHALCPGRILLLANSVAQDREAVSRMEDRERTNSDDNHDTLKDDKFRLVSHQFRAPTTSQLGNAVHASHKDTNERRDDGAREAAEARLVEERHCLRGELVAAAVCAQCVLGEEVAEDGEDDDLEDDTGNHQIGSNVLHC
jgi:hypothetical protein